MSATVWRRAADCHQRTRGAARHVQPDRLPGRRERRVRHGQPQRLRDDLAGGRGAEELAAAARRCAGAAAQLGGFFHRHQPVSEACAERLHLARILALRGQQRDAARHDHAGERLLPRQRHHHRRQTLVAGGHAHHAAAGGQRADQAAEDDRGVVAVGQAVHHAGRALRPAIARVADVARERHRVVAAELLGRGLHQHADLPMADVIAERDRRAVGRADAAHGAQDQELRAAQLGRVPAHAGVLRQAEQVAAGRVAQIVLIQRQLARWAGRVRADIVNRRVGSVEGIGLFCHLGGLYAFVLVVSVSDTAQAPPPSA